MLSKDNITGSLLAVTMKYTNYTIILMMPHVTRHFIIQAGTRVQGNIQTWTNCRIKIAYCYGLWT